MDLNFVPITPMAMALATWLGNHPEDRERAVVHIAQIWMHTPPDANEYFDMRVEGLKGLEHYSCIELAETAIYAFEASCGEDFDEEYTLGELSDWLLDL